MGTNSHYRFSLGLVVAIVATLCLVRVAPAHAYPRPGYLHRVSVASDATQSKGESRDPALSADGRYVVFWSQASNLVPGDTNDIGDIFVHDRATGTTERVSVSSSGGQAYGGGSPSSISADGRYVVFESSSNDLVPDEGLYPDVFVHDRETGTTKLVDVSQTGTPGNRGADFADISADGRFVSFRSASTDLVAGDTNNASDVFIRDLVNNETEMVSVSSSEVQGDRESVMSTVSGDGRYVAFASESTNLTTADLNGTTNRFNGRDVFVRDREAATTVKASVATDGTEGNGNSQWPMISDDGKAVAFESQASNLVPTDLNLTHDVFVRDLDKGVTERASVSSAGEEGNSVANGGLAISGDGRYVAFSSSSALEDPDHEPDGVERAFVHDRKFGTTELASTSGSGAPDSWSADPALSGDGSFVAFASEVSNLVPNDTNACGSDPIPCGADIFVRDRGPNMGFGDLRLERGPSATLSGWTRFGNSGVSEADDTVGDTPTGADHVGLDLVRVDISDRPEESDVLVTFTPSELPGIASPGYGGIPQLAFFPAIWCPSCQGPSVARAPFVLYSLDFAANDTPYEVRASLTSAGRANAPSFSLNRCSADDCERIADLHGGFATEAPAITVSIPKAALGDNVSALTGPQAHTSVGDESTGAITTVDDLTMADANLQGAGVEVAAVSAGSSPSEGDYLDVPVEAGRFSTAVDTSSFHGGAYDVWARTCVGNECSARMIPYDGPPPRGKLTTTLTTNRTLTGFRRPFTLSGEVAVEGTCTGPYEIDIHKTVAGSRVPTTTLPPVTVGDDGKWSTKVSSPVSATYTALVDSTSDCDGATSAPKEVRISPEIKVDKSSTCHLITGRVLPAYPGSRTELFRRTNQKWVKTDTTKLNDRARFALHSKACARSYRIVWPKQSLRNVKGLTEFHP